MDTSDWSLRTNAVVKNPSNTGYRPAVQGKLQKPLKGERPIGCFTEYYAAYIYRGFQRACGKITGYYSAYAQYYPDFRPRPSYADYICRPAITNIAFFYLKTYMQGLHVLSPFSKVQASNPMRLTVSSGSKELCHDPQFKYSSRKSPLNLYIFHC